MAKHVFRVEINAPDEDLCVISWVESALREHFEIVYEYESEGEISVEEIENE